MKAECSVRVGRQEMGVSSSDHMLSKGGDLHTYLLQFSVQMTATSTSPSALTADYDSYSSHTGFLPMKTASQYLVSSFRMPTGHRKWIQGHPWFIIPSFFHQLRGCWYTVLAGNTNICLYYMFDINNVPIYLSFDNNRQDQLSLLDSILETKLCWHRIMYDMNLAEDLCKSLPWVWVQRRTGLFFLSLVPLLNQWKSSCCCQLS